MIRATADFPDGNAWSFPSSWVSTAHLWTKHQLRLGATAVRIAQAGRLIAVIRPKRRAA